MDIKEMRDRTGFSQSMFGKYFNISVRTIQAWEQGVRKPPFYVVELIERVLRLEGKI